MSAAPSVRDLVIVGGGTAGWMTAAALSHMLAGTCRIRLVESEEIGTIGVGEATIPHIQAFNQALGIDEDEFLRATGGSFKLGIEFVNWGAQGERYIHGFGRVGPANDALPFHHHWLRAARAGCAEPLEAYSINTAAPRQARFLRAKPEMAGSPLGDVAHAFHFDAGRYAAFLRQRAERQGVRRTEGRIAQVQARADGGAIEAVVLASGERIAGDFFIDCSGQRAMLIEQTLKGGWDDWSHWLPCDRAVAVPSARTDPLLPMTRSTAQRAGWIWRIPLQHRTGNGHVFSSEHISEDEATALLMGQLDGEALAEPRAIRFRTGCRQRFWVGNCVAVGLSSGFLEPLESTSIHLIQTAISRIANFFPHGTVDGGFDDADIAEYNAMTRWEYERIRDFLILHYHLTRRDDSSFWNHCRTMTVPEPLRRKMALFASNGRIFREGEELFAEASWLQVMLGQGLMPQRQHPFAELRPLAETTAFLDNVQRVIARCVQAMPTHAEFIAAHCAQDAAA
jgi:tryptophan 7-halogenase